MELESKVALQRGRSLMQAIDDQERASSTSMRQVFRIQGGVLGRVQGRLLLHQQVVCGR